MARHRVDTNAPLLHVEHVLKTGKLVHELDRQRKLDRENRELLTRINQIYRSQGFLNIDYNYSVHQSLNSEFRLKAARKVERENRALLDRLLRRQPTVESNLRHGCEKPSNILAGDGPAMTIDFWERTDRWLCQLNVSFCDNETLLPELMTDRKRGAVHRIFRDTCLVLRSGPIPPDEPARPGESNTLHDVEPGCLVRQRHEQREHWLITLRKIASISGGSLVGRVVSPSSPKLDLLNYYGTKFGRCREPINYETSLREIR